jgi:phosphatidylinositol alpha-mannosyltransferase
VSTSYRLAGGPLRWLAGRLDVACVVSEDARRLAERYLGGEYEMVFNGIEVERFAKASPAPSERPTVLFLGRHEERKGLAVLLDAMAMLPTDVRIWVASDGPQTAELQQRTAGDERVEWLGRVDDGEKARRLRGADVFCAPSLHGESFGVVLLEAMAAGTPIVATEIPGYARVARADQEALLVAPGDAGALAGALRRVLTDDDLAASLAESGRRRADALSMDHLAERYLDIYRALV